MDERRIWSAGAIAALALLVWLAGPWTPLRKPPAPAGNLQLAVGLGDKGGGTGGYEGLSWHPGRAYAHHTRGGLFHPPACGEGRTGLIEWGWDWIACPPSETSQLVRGC